MASEILMNLTEEMTCPICLELLTEPLCLSCGHSFCRACITANNKESMIGAAEERYCPMCRASYQPGNLRPNRHLTNIVETLREVKLSLQEDQRRHLCALHGEKLLLFCTEDRKVICWLCERSQEHRGHSTYLIDEVAQEYQVKLQEILAKLRKEHEEAEVWKADVTKEKSSWQNQIQIEIESIQTEFKKLRSFLDSEEQKQLQKLKKEKEAVLHKLEETENEQSQQCQLVRNLISELEYLLQGPTLEMLQNVNDIMRRTEILTLKKSKAFPVPQRRVQAFDLREILDTLIELTEVQRYWVDMTLNCPSYKPHVDISKDGRQVRYIRHWNQYCEDCGVLGSKVITSGKHYWEVDVSDKHSWILGVYDETYSENDPKYSVRQGQFFKPFDRIFKYQPKYGYWVIGLHFGYKAFEDSSTADPKVLTLSVAVPPRRVGVFLDYEACTVSFFNITNLGLLIYKFSSCSFCQRTFPYFNPLKCNIPMTLCLPRS